jgi:hypothetical protein
MSTSERRKRDSKPPIRGLAFALALLASPSAHASPNYPVALASDLDLSVVPLCTICHQTLAGGTGTATKPFAVYMQSRGLVPEDTDSLKLAAEALQGEAASGLSPAKQYLAALEAGEDPNNPSGSEASGPPPPQYGCGASSIAPTHGAGRGSVGSALLMAVTILLWRRRRPAPFRSTPRGAPIKTPLERVTIVLWTRAARPSRARAPRI